MASVYFSYSPVVSRFSSSFLIISSIFRISKKASLSSSRTLFDSSIKWICSRYPKLILPIFSRVHWKSSIFSGNNLKKSRFSYSIRSYNSYPIIFIYDGMNISYYFLPILFQKDLCEYWDDSFISVYQVLQVLL